MQRVSVALAVVLTIVLVVFVENLAVEAYVPRVPRLATDFSAPFLERAIALDARRGHTVFLGDSVLWGYRVDADRTAVALLAARGCACDNLAFKSGSPANEYLLARLLVRDGAPRPERVVVEVNLAVFNATNDDYRNLHPALASAALGELSAADRALLTLPAANESEPGAVGRALERLVPLYGMRADIRETLYGEAPPPALPHLTPDLFAGAYDLVPLTEQNVGVHFLEAFALTLHAAHVPVVAFFTPTNHALLHDYIDNTLYDNNKSYLRRLLERRGARVVDLDRDVPGGEFYDNAHLTVAGQARLARLLSRALAR